MSENNNAWDVAENQSIYFNEIFLWILEGNNKDWNSIIINWKNQLEFEDCKLKLNFCSMSSNEVASHSDRLSNFPGCNWHVNQSHVRNLLVLYEMVKWFVNVLFILFYISLWLISFITFKFIKFRIISFWYSSHTQS